MLWLLRLVAKALTVRYAVVKVPTVRYMLLLGLVANALTVRYDVVRLVAKVSPLDMLLLSALLRYSPSDMLLLGLVAKVLTIRYVVVRACC